MPDDLMRYDLLAQNALKGVVREALRIAETTGLPGEHHFYIAFNTKHPGVVLSEKIATRYPREMTIVIQHQYWSLKVHEDSFEVELSFDNVPEHLIIPFDAVKGFLDPAVQFGLQFESTAVDGKSKPAELPNPEQGDGAETTAKSPESVAQEEGDKVVSLDQFRKK
jgi:hypothetical protein